MTFLCILYRQLTPLQRFRWVHCQIETLSRCFPPSIRQILDGLPKTLDETYERILLEIDEEKQVYADRLFQCLAISVRPLRVEELAEVFAVLPNTESTPGFDLSWRPEDPEAFILSACSTLVTIVDTKPWYGETTTTRTVQFSHFSVKEYLTSGRIANSAPVSHFQVLPKPAHTLLARACLSVLLQLDHNIDKTHIKNFPLARYAAMNWVDHACFEDVSSDIRDGIDRLFDGNKPHLSAWLGVYNIDKDHDLYDPDEDTVPPEQPDAVPLYYAALCGFRDLVGRLLNLHPQDLNAKGGVCGTPLCAALHKGHLDIALFLLEHGADGEQRGTAGQNGLYIASSHGYTEIVRTLIDRGADLNAVCRDWDEWLLGRNWSIDYLQWTPLHVASFKGRLEVARVLLEYGANVDHPDNLGRIPLHIASRGPCDDLVRLLLDHGANPSALDSGNETALHHAAYSGELGAVILLLDHGLAVNARNKRSMWGWRGWDPLPVRGNDIYPKGWTPLHYAAAFGPVEVVQMLLDHGADVNTPDECHWTPLHLAAIWGQLQVVDTLLQRGANPHVRNMKGHTPFEATKCHWERSPHHPQIMRLLSGHARRSGCGP